MIGQTIAHFEILEQLGQGGRGIVYKARDLQLNRVVALELLSAEKLPDEQELLLDTWEARTAGALGHPNILAVLQVGVEGAVPFIVMEYVEGKPLDRLIPPGGMPPV